MKVKRQRHVKKVLTFYRNSFSLQPPYHILLDGTFCKCALTYKVNIREQLPKYLDAEVRLYTSACVLAECRALGSLLYGPLKVLEQFDVEPCPHTSPIPASKCMKHMIRKTSSNGRTRFFMATQDPELSDDVRKISGIPLLYLSHNAINVESPSETTCTKVSKTELLKIANEHMVVKELKKNILGETEQSVRRKRKKKGGPNPLSCKKKKVKSHDSVSVNGGVKKKRKRRKRVHTPGNTLS